MKSCARCGEPKPNTAENFAPSRSHKDGFLGTCRDCRRAYIREWHRKWRATEAGRAAKREATLKWERSKKGGEKNRKAKRAWKEKNREKVIRLQRASRAAETPEQRSRRFAINADYRRRRCKIDAPFRMRVALSVRIANSLRTRGTSKRSRNWEQLVGYTLAELKAHIERQFLRGMTWDNYGEWHVDHIVPISAFHWRSPDDDDFRPCWALANLRPTWALDNLRKKDKRLFLI